MRRQGREKRPGALGWSVQTSRRQRWDPSGQFPVPTLRVHQDRKRGQRRHGRWIPLVSPATPLREACHTYPLGLRVWFLDGSSSNGKELTIPLTPAVNGSCLLTVLVFFLITVVPGVKCAFHLPKQPLAHNHICSLQPCDAG